MYSDLFAAHGFGFFAEEMQCSKSFLADTFREGCALHLQYESVQSYAGRRILLFETMLSQNMVEYESVESRQL